MASYPGMDVFVFVCVPCIHQQRGCGRGDIPIWRNVFHVSLLGDLREKERGGRQMKREVMVGTLEKNI